MLSSCFTDALLVLTCKGQIDTGDPYEYTETTENNNFLPQQLISTGGFRLFLFRS